MSQTSAAEIIHGILVQDPEGTLFTVKELTTKCKNFELDYSSGAISGFIDRALKKEVVTVFGENTNGKRGRVYRLESREPWKFKAAGVGSYPGREIHMPEKDPPSKEPIFPYFEMVEQKAVEAEPPFQNTLGPKPTIVPYREVFPVSKQLFNLAIEIELLEKQVKNPSIDKFTTDELIEELKRRVK